MKKLILGIIVTISFVIYSFHQRNDTSTAVVAPKSTTSVSPQRPQPTVSSSTQTTTTYKDGQYTGPAADAYYGYIQVQATISGGKLTDIKFLQYPNDRQNSVEINTQAMPYLKQEAIKAQTAHVDTISGATDTSMAFIQSLSSALASAQN